jgi:prepilin-type N-terminal cleavage/methylation domain-containing protein
VSQTSQRGFTLMEMMVSMGVFGILMVGMLTSAIALFGGTTEQMQVTLSVDDQTRVLDYLRRDVRSCSAMKVTGSGTGLVLQVPAAYEAVGPLPTPSPVSSTGATFGGGTIQVTYQSAGGYFTRVAGAGAVQDVAQLINGFSVAFSPATLTGAVAPPVTVTVQYQMSKARNTASSLTTMTATLQPRVNAAILP